MNSKNLFLYFLMYNVFVLEVLTKNQGSELGSLKRFLVAIEALLSSILAVQVLAIRL